jgi:hypothetical protein
MACLMQHETDVRLGYLPPAANLKEARLEANWRVPGGGFCPLSLYLVQETEALSQKVEVFVLLQAQSIWAAQLRDAAVKLKAFLEKRQTPCLFRLDPRYGLTYGSALEPVDPAVKWDRPGTYVALYLTDDPASPSLALLDYVAQGHRRRFQDLFLKYNRIPASTPSLLKSTWKKLVGTEGKLDPGQRKLNYRLLRSTAAFLAAAKAGSPLISLIYKDVSSADSQRNLLDASFSTYSSSGQDRFFASLGELA